MSTSGSTRTTLISPFQYFADPTKARPIFNGFIYIGRVDGDPTNPMDQIPIQLICECGGSPVNVTQPVRTGPGGVPIYNGNPAQIIVCQSRYSITLQDKDRVQVYHSPDVTSGFINKSITHLTLANAMADDNTLLQSIKLLDRAGAEFRRATNQDEYNLFPESARFTDASSILWVLNSNNKPINPINLGLNLDGTDETELFQDVINYAAIETNPNVINIPSGSEAGITLVSSRAITNPLYNSFFPWQNPNVYGLRIQNPLIITGGGSFKILSSPSGNFHRWVFIVESDDVIFDNITINCNSEALGVTSFSILSIGSFDFMLNVFRNNFTISKCSILGSETESTRAGGNVAILSTRNVDIVDNTFSQCGTSLSMHFVNQLIIDNNRNTRSYQLVDLDKACKDVIISNNTYIAGSRVVDGAIELNGAQDVTITGNILNGSATDRIETFVLISGKRVFGNQIMPDADQQSQRVVVSGNTMQYSERGIRVPNFIIDNGGTQDDCYDLVISNNSISELSRDGVVSNAIEIGNNKTIVIGNSISNVEAGIITRQSSSATDITISDNSIENASNVGIFLDGSSSTQTERSVISNNRLHNVGLAGNDALQAGISLRESRDSIVSGNIISACRNDNAIRLIHASSAQYRSMINNNICTDKPIFVPESLTNVLKLFNYEAGNIISGDLTGTGVPTIVPKFIGENYLDTDNDKWYKASGLTSSDWEVLN